jgi:hypothetical protein
MKFALMAACIASMAAFAASMTPAAAAPPPPGSYGATCRDARFDGRTLIATCQTRAHTPYTSALDVSDCGQPLAVDNDNGRLVCRSRQGVPIYGQELRRPSSNEEYRRPGYEDPYRRPSYGDDQYRPAPRPQYDRTELPRGSWQRSCEVESFDYGILRAACQTRDGDSNSTRIDVRRCGNYPRIANIDGNLVCER